MSNLYNLKQPVQAEQYVSQRATICLKDLIVLAGEGWEWAPDDGLFNVLPWKDPDTALNDGDWFVYYGPDAGWEILSDEEFKDTFSEETQA